MTHVLIQRKKLFIENLSQRLEAELL